MPGCRWGLAQPVPWWQSSRQALAFFLQTNPPSLDYAEDLAALVSLNECSAMNTLQQRYQARLPYTYAGASLVAIRPSFAASSSSGKVSGEPGGGGSPVGSDHRPPWGQWRRTPGTVVPADGTVGPSQGGRDAPGGDALRTLRTRDAWGWGGSEDTEGRGCLALGTLWRILGAGDTQD